MAIVAWPIWLCLWGGHSLALPRQNFASSLCCLWQWIPADF